MSQLGRLLPILVASLLSLAVPVESAADEIFVKIHKVSGNRISITQESQNSGRRGGGDAGARQAPGSGSSRRGRGRIANFNAQGQQQKILQVPSDAKITSAMRERRTFELRVGAELPGGLRNELFRSMRAPLSARILISSGRVEQINVLTTQTDINQSNADESGGAVIAVRPKRPPMKSKR